MSYKYKELKEISNKTISLRWRYSSIDNYLESKKKTYLTIHNDSINANPHRYVIIKINKWINLLSICDKLKSIIIAKIAERPLSNSHKCSKK